jgi:hypothetical protein
MATNANPFVVNIVPLSGISPGITSSSDTAGQILLIQENVANLQSMVNYDTKTVSADFITSFTQGDTIQITENINLSSISLYSNGSLVSLGTSGSNSLSTIQFTSLTSNNSYISGTASTVSLTTAGNEILQVIASNAVDSSGSVSINGTLRVSGNAHVQALFQTSDRTLKTNIQPFTTCLDDILKIEPCSFNWVNTGEPDLGFIAQDIKETWPSLTDGKSIAYSRFVPLLLEGLRELNGRVSTLEGLSK